MMDLAEVFSALGDPTRLEMMRTILADGEVACTTFDEMFPIGKSAISYHVKVLRHAGLITVRKEGRFYYYRPREEAFERDLRGLPDLLGGKPRESAASVAVRRS